jgi:hypothetical protein
MLSPAPSTRRTDATVVVPLPLNAIVVVVPLLAFELMTMLADAAPALVGLKVTLIEQPAAGASVPGQPLEYPNEPAPVPVFVTLEIDRVAVPLLVTDNDRAALLVPTA